MQSMINGISMAYDDLGSGPPVLLIHGFPLCRKMWRLQAEALAAAGYRVITPDLRGFGDSDAPDGPYRIELFADDILELLDHLGIERAVVGGMSMGGYILLRLLLQAPERVRAALFITTRSTADDEAGKARRLALAKDVMRYGPQVITDAFTQVLFAPGTPEEKPDLAREAYSWMVATSSRGLAGGLLAMRERPDFTPLLPTIRQPSLVISAVQDQAAPPATADTFTRGLPNCTARLIPRGGHLVNLEEPELFNSVLLEFLATLPS